MKLGDLPMNRVRNLFSLLWSRLCRLFGASASADKTTPEAPSAVEPSQSTAASAPEAKAKIALPTIKSLSGLSRKQLNEILEKGRLELQAQLNAKLTGFNEAKSGKHCLFAQVRLDSEVGKVPSHVEVENYRIAVLTRKLGGGERGAPRCSIPADVIAEAQEELQRIVAALPGKNDTAIGKDCLLALVQSRESVARIPSHVYGKGKPVAVLTRCVGEQQTNPGKRFR
jgi:hypothetical protein